MIPIFPKGFLEKFTQEHPVQAILVLACGFAMIVFAIALMVLK